MDWNDDGLLDIIVGGRDGMIDHFQAVDDSDTYPTLTFVGHVQANSATIDVGYNAAPVLIDWNEDGLIDLLVGSEGSITPGTPSVRLYLNSGTPSNPALTTYTNVQAGGSAIDEFRCVPDVEDANGDGKKDLVAGEYYGYVFYYENTGNNSNPVLASGVQLTYNYGSSYVDPGYSSRPYVHDWNEDGYVDMLVGATDGYVRVYYGYSTGVGDDASASMGVVDLGIAVNPACGVLGLLLNLPDPEQVEVSFYATDGRLVETLDAGALSEGDHLLSVDLGHLPAGVYYAACAVSGEELVEPFVLVK